MYINKLQELCEKDNITMTSLGKELKCDRSTIGKYINGYLPIPLKHLNALCNYFNISIDYVLGFTETKNYANNKYSITENIFFKNIKELRKELKISQSELANIINCTRSVISDYENNKRMISTSHLYTICKKYKISADYLLGKTDTPKYYK